MRWQKHCSFMSSCLTLHSHSSIHRHWGHFLSFLTCVKSYFPRTHLSLTPGRSCTLPPLTSTTLCSWRLWPSPGTYAVTSLPLLNRTRTHFRFAEFGFLGFLIRVLKTTPRRNGRQSSGPGLGGGLLKAPRLCIWFSVDMHLTWFNIVPANNQ